LIFQRVMEQAAVHQPIKYVEVAGNKRQIKD